MHRHFVVFLVKAYTCDRPALLFVAGGCPFASRPASSLKWTTPGACILAGSRWMQGAAGDAGQGLPGAATSCLLFVYLIHLPRQLCPRPGGTCSVTNGVFKKWGHVRASAKSIPSKENSTLKLVTWALLQFCRHPDPWHPFNQITNTCLSPVTYTQNSDSLAVSTRIIKRCGFPRNSRSAHQVLCRASIHHTTGQFSAKNAKYFEILGHAA